MRKFIAFIMIFLIGCSQKDDNDVPIYSSTSGLPVNCRAFVQFAIEEYRNDKYSADDTFASLERNCGARGYSWKNEREK